MAGFVDEHGELGGWGSAARPWRAPVRSWALSSQHSAAAVACNNVGGLGMEVRTVTPLSVPAPGQVGPHSTVTCLGFASVLTHPTATNRPLAAQLGPGPGDGPR